MQSFPRFKQDDAKYLIEFFKKENIYHITNQIMNLTSYFFALKNATSISIIWKYRNG